MSFDNEDRALARSLAQAAGTNKSRAANAKRRTIKKAAQRIGFLPKQPNMRTLQRIFFHFAE
jgi:hypothetical protein